MILPATPWQVIQMSFFSSFHAQDIDQIMVVHGTQFMQAVLLILEGDHGAEVKEQVRCPDFHNPRLMFQIDLGRIPHVVAK